ncbi:MAG: type IV secretory system conjugative DNA transfer family protein [Saccharofermentans sp.]|nr:type IV secretory system conjugative DNA transfer family protein [Saccharofermentans sp.]
MNNKTEKRMYLTIGIVGAFPIAYLAFLLSPVISFEQFRSISAVLNLLNDYTTLIYCDATIPAIIVSILIFWMLLYVKALDQMGFRRGRDRGDQQLGDPKKIGKQLSHKDYFKNVIFTKNVKMYYNDKVVRKTIAALVLGSMGSGKSRFVLAPILMQMIGSYIVLDPAGDLLETTGKMLEENGYVIKILNLKEPEKSDFYNPFVYLRKDEDISSLATSLFKNTSPPDSKPDPFFDPMAEGLLKALMFVVYYECPPDEKNFNTLMYLFHQCDVREDDEDYKSPLHLYMEDLEKRNPMHPALSYWKESMLGPAKTVKSIIQSLSAHLSKFNDPAIANLTQMDTMELSETGERKTALFMIIPERDKSLNFICSMLYTSLFDELYRCADVVHKNDSRRLPEYTLFLMDEVANVAAPEGFDGIWSTARKRGIGIMMFLQSLNQLETTFGKSGKTFQESADEILFLGTQSKDTMQYFSDMMGEETINVESFGETKGSSGSSSKNVSTASLKVMTVAQIRTMQPDECLLFIKNTPAILDKKYDPTKHPRAKLTTISGGNAMRYKIKIGDIGYESPTFIQKTKEIEKISEDTSIVWLDYIEESKSFMPKARMMTGEQFLYEAANPRKTSRRKRK